MGIRIRKEIGYFIPVEKYNGFIVQNYEDVLEDLDENSETHIEHMLEAFKNFEFQSKHNMDNVFLKYLANEYEKEKNKFQAYNFLSQVYFGDDVVGIMIKTPELHKKTRYDDLIDYYENNLAIEDTIRYLNQPIYPSQGYVYTGGLEKEFPELEVGKIYDMFHIKCIYLTDTLKLAEDKKTEFVCKSGHFRPNIEGGAFVIAKTFGILEEHITENDFLKMMEPVIITSWG
jgi:hypothetical protein